MLELAREQLVNIAQAEPYAPIYVQLKASRPSRWPRTNERRTTNDDPATTPPTR